MGKRKGMLSGIRPDDLAVEVLKELVNRAGISSVLINNVILGCVTQIGEQAMNIARTAALTAGFPIPDLSMI